MIKRKLVICCKEFEKNKDLFRTVLSTPFALQGILVLPLSEKEILINYCPFCGAKFPKYIDKED